MRAHDLGVSVALAAAFAQIADEFFAGIELRLGRLLPVKIADQANTQRDIIQIIAVHMAAVDLPPPTIADLDRAVARRGAVADDEVIGQPVPHSPHIAMVIIEGAGVALPRAAVVHDDEFPACALHLCTADGIDCRTR